MLRLFRNKVDGNSYFKDRGFVTMMGKNPQIKIYPLYQPIIVSCTVQSLFRLKIVNFIETLN